MRAAESPDKLIAAERKKREVSCDSAQKSILRKDQKYKVSEAAKLKKVPMFSFGSMHVNDPFA